MFYGWKLGWIGFISNLLLQGGGIYIMNALMEPLSDLHGWSRGTISTIMALSSLAGTLSMPLLGTLALRCSLRTLMICGALMGSMGYVLMGHTSNIFLFTLCFSGVWIGGQACGGVIGNALICNWFFRHRGRAFGLVNMGTSMSGAVLPFAAMLLINSLDVSTAMNIIGACTLLALLPACIILVRDNPESLGMQPDGDSFALGNAAAGSPKVEIIPWGHLLRMPECYRVGLIYGIGIMVAAGVVGQLKPRFSDLGFDDTTAMSFMALAAFSGAIGKYLWGWLSDYLSPLRTTRILILCNIMGLGVTFLPANLGTALLFAIYTGGCVGGFWAVFPNAVVYVFGRRRFVSIYRFVSGFVTVKALGYYFMGVSIEQTGSYNSAYLFFMAALGLAFVLLLFVRRQDDEEMCRTLE